MPKKSVAQGHFMGMCYGAAKEGHPMARCPSMKVAKEFAQGSYKGLPQHVAKKGKKK